MDKWINCDINIKWNITHPGKDKMRNIKIFKSIFEQKSQFIGSNTKPEVLESSTTTLGTERLMR